MILQHRCAAVAIVSVFIAGMLAAALSHAQQPPTQPATAPSLPPEVAAGHAAFDKQEWDLAIKHYRAALAAGYNVGLVQMRLGYALHVQGRLDDAMVHHLKAAESLNKELRVDGLYNAACASALMGKNDDALRYMTLAIDAGFADASHARTDSDMKSLQSDEKFQKLLAGIGTTPKLHQWMDFFIGEWTTTADDGRIIQKITFTKPLPNSHGLHSISTNQGAIAWTGLAYPKSDDRTWRWIEANAAGMSHELIGTRSDDGGMTFTGRDVSPAGPGVHLRFTYTPQPDGSIREKCETSENGLNWRTHHEETYKKEP